MFLGALKVQRLARQQLAVCFHWNESLGNFRVNHKTTMSATADKQFHLEITAKQARHDVMSPAVVTNITQESKSVRGISLKVEHPEFVFKAGQWIDTVIPGIEEVGGFSICSSPCKLGKSKTLDLAVKNSRRAPAHWFHSECKIGSKLEIRAGGDFHFVSSSASSSDHILLIGGGVGVNPLASIFQYCADLHRARDPIAPEKVLLLFSAKQMDEILFKEIFSSIAKEIPSIQCKFFITSQSASNGDFPVERTRITKNHLQDALALLDKNKVTSYICGPLAMINDMKAMLEVLGIPQRKLLYEKWW